MSDEIKRKFQKELNSGALSLVLLTLIQQQDAAVYGYEVGRLLRSAVGESLPMNQGAIYPVLRSLETQGLLSSKLMPSEFGPPRKYYQLTTVGRRMLPIWREAWQSTKSFVDSILETSDEQSVAGVRPEVHEKTGTGTQKPVRRPRRGSVE